MKVSLLFCGIVLFQIAFLGAREACAAEPVPEPSTRRIYDYTGVLGDNLRIGMTLTFSADGKTISGTYFYARYCKDIRVEGEVDGRKLILREFDAAGAVTALFTGEFPEKDPRHRYGDSKLDHEVIVGSWSRTDGTGKRTFDVSLTQSSILVPGENMYRGGGFDNDAEVNAFASKFRRSVLARDVNAVAAMVSYPIEINIGDKRRKIRNAAALRQHYDEIFDADYVRRIEATVPFHMFSNWQGVMMGDGEVWIVPIAVKASDSGREKTVPRVFALNR